MAETTIEQALRTAIQQHQAGQLHEAEALYEQILVRQPNHPDALNLLGVIARRAGHTQRAVDLARRAIAIAPNWPEAHSNLGNALKANAQLEHAIAAYRHAVSLRPDLPEPHGNLGIALHDLGQSDEAIAEYHQAITLRHNYPQAHYNLGVAFSDKRQLNEAVAAFVQAIALSPNMADAHFGLALVLLLQGDLLRGWKEYEWRWQAENFSSERWSFAQPQWNGDDLGERTIFLHDEQGIGDTIQFIRYLPLLAQRGGRVIHGCPPPLRRLLHGMAGVAQWIAWNELLPPFDVHCPLLSLPLAFGTCLHNIPATVPYLQAEADDIARWRIELAGDTSRLKVGLAWAGNPTHRNDRNRSAPLNALAPLSQVPGVSFYSLQKGEAAKQAKDRSDRSQLIDRTNDLHDFADTAALITNLDLVISVDTAVAHLAGAMAKPVWVMLPFLPDWRWMLDRNDSPWYPTMRLFRQASAGDWDGVVSQVTRALSDFAQGRDEIER